MLFTVKCLYCNKEFEAERSTRHFDTDACRKAYKRLQQDKKENVIKQVIETISEKELRGAGKAIDDQVKKDIVDSQKGVSETPVTESDHCKSDPCEFRHPGKTHAEWLAKVDADYKEAVEHSSIPGSKFVPNWKRMGLKSKEEGLAKALEALAARGKDTPLGTFTLGKTVVDLGSPWIEKKKRKK